MAVSIVTIVFVLVVVLTVVKFRPKQSKRGYKDMTREEISALMKNENSMEGEPGKKNYGHIRPGSYGNSPF